MSQCAYVMLNKKDACLLTYLHVVQAVFVVSINLQGAFIFCFHCVRSAAVRSEWKTVLIKVPTTRQTITDTRQSYSNLQHKSDESITKF